MSGTDIRVVRTIAPEQVDEVAALIVEAFEQKIRHELKPRSPEQAHRIVARSLDPALGWVALDEAGAVIGVIGIGTRGRTFSHLGYRMLAEEFGPLGAVPRRLVELFEDVLSPPRRNRWRIEALAVTERARGTGAGTALLHAVIDAAREAGVRSVGLEVVDVNEGALRLYERVGFRATRTLRTGWITAGGGYRGVHFMRLDL